MIWACGGNSVRLIRTRAISKTKRWSTAISQGSSSDEVLSSDVLWMTRGGWLNESDCLGAIGTIIDILLCHKWHYHPRRLDVSSQGQPRCWWGTQDKDGLSMGSYPHQLIISKSKQTEIEIYLLRYSSKFLLISTRSYVGGPNEKGKLSRWMQGTPPRFYPEHCYPKDWGVIWSQGQLWYKDGHLSVYRLIVPR